MNKIKVQVAIAAAIQKVWDYYTQPEHILNWNFASDDWCCPSASNDLRKGGKYIARMEAKDGSFGFDFEATYLEVNVGENFSYSFGDRKALVEFHSEKDVTILSVLFDPEKENSIELQQQGWQSILDNFKKYTESH